MNNNIFYFLYSFAHRNIYLDKLIIFFAVYSPYLVVFLAIIFLLFHHEVLFSKNPFAEFKKKWKEIVLAFFTGSVAWVLAKILKIFVHTSRPFLALSNVHSLFYESGYAFPSGHATFYSGLAFIIFFYHKKIGTLFLLSAFIIGMARVMGGVHFPIDILGGYVLGFLVAFFVKNV